MPFDWTLRTRFHCCYESPVRPASRFGNMRLMKPKLTLALFIQPHVPFATGSNRPGETEDKLSG